MIYEFRNTGRIFSVLLCTTELAAVYLCCRMTEDADQLDFECCEGGVGEGEQREV
jgi:hypothetical protein